MGVTIGVNVLVGVLKPVGVMKGAFVGMPLGVDVLLGPTNGVGVLVGVFVRVDVGTTTGGGVYVRTEITAGSADRFKVYMNHLPVAGSLKVAGVACSP